MDSRIKVRDERRMTPACAGVTIVGGHGLEYGCWKYWAGQALPLHKFLVEQGVALVFISPDFISGAGLFLGTLCPAVSRFVGVPGHRGVTKISW